MKVDVLVAVGEKGGVENVINMTIPFLQKQGWEARVVQLVWEGKEWTTEGIPFFPLLKGKDNHTLLEFREEYAKFIKKQGKPDLILATAWPSMCYVARSVIEKMHLLRTKVISWLHAPVGRYIDAGFGGYEHLKLADAHLAISAEIYEDLKKHYSRVPVCKVYNPVDFEWCKRAKRGSFLQARRKLYYIGRVSEEKRLDVILQGVAVTNGEWELHVIGDDGNRYGEAMKKLAQTINVDQQIHWYGWQNNPWDMVKDANAVVLASEYEGFPLTAIEAQANGIPVISTPVSGIQELIEDGVNGYIFPFGDWKALGITLCKIADSNPILPEVCEKRVVFYEKNHAVQHFYQQIYDLVGEWNESEQAQLTMSEEERARQIEQITKDRKDWLEKVFHLIHSGRMDMAKELFYQVLIPDGAMVQQYWLDDASAILDVMFKIYEAEKTNQSVTLLHRLKSIDTMKEMYYEFRFLVRRFEYDLPRNLCDELVPFVARHHMSGHAIVEMVKTCVTSQEKVLNQIAVCMINHKRYACVLPLLTYATDINPYHMDTLYNLTYFLYLCGEKETALEYGNILKDEMPDAARLYDIMVSNETLPSYDGLHKMHFGELSGELEIDVPETTEKICFITCVNNERQYVECCHYIDNLIVPEGYEIEKIAVRGANSMTSGYQQAMKESNAKYKVYLHQDAYCRNRYFLYEAIAAFESDENIGIIGVAGATTMPETGVWWNSEDNIIYSLYQDSIAYYGCQLQEALEKEYVEMEALDGVFLMTSKDVDWRQDLFDGWHLYDASQTKEFLLQGYKAVIVRQKNIWVLHCEKCQMYLGNDYEEARKKYVEEYMKM